MTRELIRSFDVCMDMPEHDGLPVVQHLSKVNEIVGVARAYDYSRPYPDSLDPDPEPTLTPTVVIGLSAGNMYYKWQMSPELAIELLDLLDQTLPQ